MHRKNSHRRNTHNHTRNNALLSTYTFSKVTVRSNKPLIVSDVETRKVEYISQIKKHINIIYKTKTKIGK